MQQANNPFGQYPCNPNARPQPRQLSQAELIQQSLQVSYIGGIPVFNPEVFGQQAQATPVEQQITPYIRTY